MTKRLKSVPWILPGVLLMSASAAAAEEDGIDVRLPNGQVYVNYRHRMLYSDCIQ